MKALEHWMVQIVEIQMSDEDTNKHKIWATFYDPLGVSSNLEVCEAKWISFTLPLLQECEVNTDSAPLAPQRVLPEVVSLLYPKQADAVSCDILSIAQAYSYVSHVRSLKTSKSISQNDLAQMRLRLMWTMLHESTAADEDRDVEVWADFASIRKKG
ncbi:hypothetical protein JG687_00003964 [Phytophthora cactorum]|uniref:Ulp1 protease family, C-terminal catalytic domain n=1 Tax=Phytophthora cactorum TaxID=29920 RepID=A0A8T1URA1_9STRA|nr:hypothetical protein JG687_00003964 [Phytophthora cactorum]